MSSRIPLPYGPKVIELFRNPKNLGRMENPDAYSLAGSPACGDMIAVYLKVSDDGIIEKATFESYGCAANIAAASMLTELIKNKHLKDAWKITWREISDALGGLPAIKFHCGILAVGALRRAIREYFKDKEKPDWLPSELTKAEKQALEEEKLLEKLAKEKKALLKIKE